MGEQMTMMKSEEVSWPFVVSDRIQSVDQKSCERWLFTISELLCEFPQISRTLLYYFITVRLGYHKFCTRWVPKMLMGAYKNREWLQLLQTFLEQYHKDGKEFLSYIVRVTGDETWVSFVNVVTKEQSKQWMHTHSPTKPKSLNKCCLPES
jgi:hypothetical protein